MTTHLKKNIPASFLTRREKHAEDIVRAFSQLRKKAPPKTSDYHLCVMLAEQMGMHANSVLYHIKKAKVYRPYWEQWREYKTFREARRNCCDTTTDRTTDFSTHNS